MAWVMTDEERARVEAQSRALATRERIESVEQARRAIRKAERIRNDDFTPQVRELRRSLDALVKRVRASS